MILTDFQKEMKQPEFHASKLIVEQLHVHPFLLNSKAVMSAFIWHKWNTYSERSYHKTISIIYAATLFQVWQH